MRFIQHDKAFRDADLLAEALDARLSGRRPLDAALAYYERQRNKAVLPIYDFTYQLAGATARSKPIGSSARSLDGAYPGVLRAGEYRADR